MPNPQALKCPVPLGKLLTASFATLTIPLNVNLPALGPDGVSSAGPWNEIQVLAAPGNAGNVYVCVPLTGQAANAAPDTTNWTNVIAVLGAGASWSRYDNASWSNKWFLNDYYLGFDNGTDYAIGSAGRF